VACFTLRVKGVKTMLWLRFEMHGSVSSKVVTEVLLAADPVMKLSRDAHE
jgi:hypothetical protein